MLAFTPNVSEKAKKITYEIWLKNEQLKKQNKLKDNIGLGIDKWFFNKNKIAGKGISYFIITRNPLGK